MSDTQGPKPTYAPTVSPDRAAEPPMGWTSQLDTLLAELQELTQAAPVEPLVDQAVDNQLVQVRLGIASSLFTALRYKHAPTAAHALRVALVSSAWCLRMGLRDEERDKIEIAALLHDLGVIGIPDQILRKPGLLDMDEATIIERSRHMNVEILRSACAEPDVLAIVENVPARYDGARPGYRVSGEAIPLGARIIAIVESYDSMTNEQVFRPAASQETAVDELFACAGGQFDPQLVREFAEFCREDLAGARQEAVRRWLQTLDPRAVEHYWRFHHAPTPSGQLDRKRIFETRLLDNMHDAVIFVDEQLSIQLWNAGAERMTGLAGRSVCQRHWLPELLNLRDEKGNVVEPDDCPLRCAMRSGVQSLRRLVIWGRSGRPVPVDAHVIPVPDEDGRSLGAALLLHDASSEISLEQRCQNLHDKAIRDSMTGVANRAEFDRVHEMFIAAHLQRRLPCSLIICDLDHFKLVNDNYGHQAGDEVIKSLAGVLKNTCRTGDLVARYGGEEFVLLCTDCDNATAARRAEEARYAMSRATHPYLGERPVTASFGVTEIQPGDTPETMFRRADRALLMAKARGRNVVVQLGSGSRGSSLAREMTTPVSRVAGGRTWIEQDLVTAVPMSVAVEKLRGFVADHRARILDVAGNRVSLQIEHHTAGPRRRRGDRTIVFFMELELTDQRLASNHEGEEVPLGGVASVFAKTQVHVAITPRTTRNRRGEDISRRAREVLISLRSYLMATQEVAGVADLEPIDDRVESSFPEAGARGPRDEEPRGALRRWFRWAPWRR